MQIDPKDRSSRELYYLLTSCVTPRPIAWVSTLSHDGVRNLAPFSFFNAITSRPPLLSISVGRRRGVRKDTSENASRTRELVVNVVTEDALERMVETAAEVPPEVDEFERAGVTAVDSVLVKPPRVAEAPVSFECRVRQLVEISPGIVDLVIAEVVMVHIADSVPVSDDLRIKGEDLPLVGRLGGSEYGIIGARRAVTRK